MKKVISIAVCFCALFLVCCKRELTLQKYFVENSESKGFLSLDVSPSMFAGASPSGVLSVEEKAVLSSLKKINILAFEVNDSNHLILEQELAKVEIILKNEKYHSLIKVGQGKKRFSVQYVGDEDHIQEFVLFSNQEAKGFVVIRVLGKDMNLTPLLMKKVNVLAKLDVDITQFMSFENIFNKK